MPVPSLRKWYVVMEFPSVVHSDRGTQFTGQVITELCKLLNIEKTTTTAYHPEGNGLVEHANGTLIQIISSYCNNATTDWDEYLSTALFSYRCAQQESTRESPFFLLNGREAQWPLHPLYPVALSEDGAPRSDYNIRLQERLQGAWETACVLYCSSPLLVHVM